MIIDFRLRPPVDAYLKSEMYSLATISRINRIFSTGTPDGPRAARERSMTEMLKEMDQAGISFGVSHGRFKRGSAIPNGGLHRLTVDYPDRFTALASVDVRNVDVATAMIDEAIGTFKLPGVALDMTAQGYAVDDPRLFPIYEHCGRLGCFVAISLSMMGSLDLELAHPAALDRAARNFPGTTFISSHASFPFLLEVVAIAMKRENVWLSPEMYMTHAPGGEILASAAGGYLQDRFLFGSAYPYAPLGEVVERYLRLPLSASVRDKIMHGNARRLLKR